MSQQERKAGDRVPDVTFRVRRNDAFHDVTTADLFAGRRVALFALPGAFMPTCSSTHLPGFIGHADKLRAAGIDAIYCLSVNDSFVMNAWAADQGATEDSVVMIPDGSGHFSRAMGMLVNKDDLGFGDRSWRYAMVVNDGVIEQIWSEDRDTPDDPFAVSDAATMLGWLEGRNQKPAD